MAFFNDGVDWINGISQRAGARAFANFDGPGLRIYGYVGPSYGKINLRIIQKTSETNEEKIILDSFEIDCYSFQEENKIIFEKTDLEYQEYNLELEVVNDKNILSSSNSIRIEKITFLSNFNFVLGNQELNPNLSFKSIGGVR